MPVMVPMQKTQITANLTSFDLVESIFFPALHCLICPLDEGSGKRLHTVL